MNTLTDFELVFTFSDPPRVTSHANWEEVYGILRQQFKYDGDPFFLELNGFAVILVDDGRGSISATLRTSEQAVMHYTLFGGVWVKLSDEA